MTLFTRRRQCMKDPATEALVTPYLTPEVVANDEVSVPHPLVCSYEALARVQKRHISHASLQNTACSLDHRALTCSVHFCSAISERSHWQLIAPRLLAVTLSLTNRDLCSQHS